MCADWKIDDNMIETKASVGIFERHIKTEFHHESGGIFDFFFVYLKRVFVAITSAIRAVLLFRRNVINRFVN